MVTERAVALSTVDNPYNPLEDFGNWYVRDNLMGYNTCGMLMRVHDMLAARSGVKKINIEEVIDIIIGYDLTGRYVKVVQDAA